MIIEKPNKIRAAKRGEISTMVSGLGQITLKYLMIGEDSDVYTLEITWTCILYKNIAKYTWNFILKYTYEKNVIYL